MFQGEESSGKSIKYKEWYKMATGTAKNHLEHDESIRESIKILKIIINEY